MDVCMQSLLLIDHNSLDCLMITGLDWTYHAHQFISGFKKTFFLKTQPGGFFGFCWVFRGFFKFQCAVLDAIHIK